MVGIGSVLDYGVLQSTNHLREIGLFLCASVYLVCVIFCFFLKLQSVQFLISTVELLSDVY